MKVDGDVIRELYENDLGFSERDRELQIKRIQKFALFLENQNQIVLVSALYCNEKLMKWNRENFNSYFEIYLDASLSVVESRDSKGLYKKFREGKEKNVVGLDIPWYEPKNPDIKIKIDKSTSINFIVRKIFNVVDL